MVAVEKSVRINRPLHDVFVYVEDETNMPAWDDDLVEATRTSEGPTGVGSTFHLDIKPFMGVTKGSGEIVGYEPDRQIELQFDMGRIDTHVWHTFSADDTGTTFTRRIELSPRGPMRLMAPLMGRMVAKRNVEILATLKRILEGDPA